MINKINGFSLFEVIIGISIFSAISFLASDLISQSQKIVSKSVLQTDIDKQHLINLQYIRNIDYLKTKIVAADAKLIACLGGRAIDGSSCSSSGSCCSSYQTAFKSLALNTNLSSATAQIQTTAQYKFACSTTSCSQLQVRLSTVYVPDPTKPLIMNYAPRITDTFILGVTLGKSQSINFSCSTSSAGYFLTGINYQNSQGVCYGFPNASGDSLGYTIISFGAAPVSTTTSRLINKLESALCDPTPTASGPVTKNFGFKGINPFLSGSDCNQSP